ncbi:muramoyltetrapeptide carboxypeptidase [Pedobacter westerhofensis]|uniref:Muramoyltetrapeptide carboxypeptidase n=1 Tax=Pedobacter westerhofensis TaxID=425512 RepID=A0A521E828_9SPHI|nr:LD-carboxypeptidase [Pedobacter westerhofensis]SMO80098.1 muramoyltetrapeptide carboxypeptidase [Pedobacter westerhofensis]
MNRKSFISSLITSGAVLSAADGWSAPPAPISAAPAFMGRQIIPPYLKPGNTIGITSPAGYIGLEEIRSSVALMESWGFKVQVGQSIGKKDFTYGGTDTERAADLQQMLDDPQIGAVICARGGYGLVRIIDQINFRSFVKHPKWVIGFSDVTVLHTHIHGNFNIATLHSKMCNSFPDDWAKAEPIQISTILSVRQALTGEDFKYTVPATTSNREGRGRGQLVGGNLSIIESVAGTVSDLNTEGKILFVEDTGEYLYTIDRMFWGLKRRGKLDRLAGLVIGGFKLKPDDSGEEFGKSIEQIVMEKVSEYNYPVCFDFPVGHQRNNMALKCGVQHILEVGAGESILRSI